MYDWTKVSKDPMNDAAHAGMRDYIASIIGTYSCGRTELLSVFAQDKHVLDIGAGEHDPAYFSPDWEHQHIANAASRCIGLDIDPELVAFYNGKGFNFIQMDATSETDMGERFDFIFCGDVIEHTNSPVDLVRFIVRHLAEDGFAIITTPNPFSNFFRRWHLRAEDEFFQGNLEHTCWVTATNMNEICRRAGVTFAGLYIHKTVLDVRNAQPGFPVDLLPPEFIYKITA